ncbi:MAG TPA: outer membrane beta-barrel protein [Ohtaekwangia sp.]|uniref:outer membrane beta-barrel protein n=1 Tax=Ohtaekwangia sp. TaxID=2066019 RepID=UPI002F938800
MNSKKIYTILSLILVSASFATTTYGQTDSTKTFTLSGSIDTYFHTSFGTTNSKTITDGGFQPYAPTTSFANLKGFALGMANLIASYQGEKAGFVADLVFGPRGSDAVFNSGKYRNLGGAGSGQIVNQMYVYYKLTDAITVNLGQFNTFVGYEVISPTINVNYSTSYLFSNGPFNHTGARVDFAFGDGMVAKVAVMNPTDILEFNTVNTFTLGGQIGKTTDAGGIWLNFLYGDQDGTLKKVDLNGDGLSSGKLFQADLTTGWTLSDAFYLGFNTSYQSIAAGEYKDALGDIKKSTADATSFFGFAVYPKLTLSESFALGLRGEYFSITKNHLLASPISTNAAGNGNVIEATLSGNYKVGGLTFIPEFRIDKMSEDFFLDSNGKSKDLMATLTMAAVYKF